MRLYRTYRYGVRLTVSANDPKEARRKIDAITREFKTARNMKRFKERPDLTPRIFFSARSLASLNEIEG